MNQLLLTWSVGVISSDYYRFSNVNCSFQWFHNVLLRLCSAQPCACYRTNSSVLLRCTLGTWKCESTVCHTLLTFRIHISFSLWDSCTWLDRTSRGTGQPHHLCSCCVIEQIPYVFPGSSLVFPICQPHVYHVRSMCYYTLSPVTTTFPSIHNGCAGSSPLCITIATTQVSCEYERWWLHGGVWMKTVFITLAWIAMYYRGSWLGAIAVGVCFAGHKTNFPWSGSNVMTLAQQWRRKPTSVHWTSFSWWPGYCLFLLLVGEELSLIKWG